MFVVAVVVAVMAMGVVAVAAAVVVGGTAAVIGDAAGLLAVAIATVAVAAHLVSRLLTARLPAVLGEPGRARAATAVGALLGALGLLAIGGLGRVGIGWGLAMAVGGVSGAMASSLRAEER